MIFRGRIQRNLDSKNRLMLPTDYRASLALSMQKVVTNQDIFLQSTLSTQAQDTSTIQDTASFKHPHSPLENEVSTSHKKTSSKEGKDSLSLVETRFILTTYDQCLVAYLWHDWLKLEEKFARLSNASAGVRAFRRLIIGGAEEHSFDTQGRIRLSSDHKEYANIDKEVVVLGLVNRFEIWSPKRLKANLEIPNLDDVSNELRDSGIDFNV